MNVTVADILDLRDWSEAKVVAGHEGMHRSVTWCNVVDMEKPWKWINHGELVFLNGIGLTDKEEDLNRLLSKMELLQGGALVVQVGYYIKEIPKSVLDLANEYDVPVITVPFGVRIPILTYQICQMLFRKEGDGDTPESLMKELMYLEYDSTMESKLKFYGYNPQGYYIAIAIEPDNSIRNIQESSTDLPVLSAMTLQHLKESLERYHKELLYLREGTVLLVLIPLDIVPDYKAKLTQALRKMMNKLQSQYKHTFCVGVSNIFGKASFIKGNCNKAKEALNMLHACKKTNDIRFFEDMGIYSLLFRIHQKEELEHVLELTLGRLIKHDEAHNSDLVHILDTFLSEDCNLMRTAELLFAHRNTMKYKIAKIQEVLLCDLKDVNTCFNLRLAYKIKRFLEIE